MVFIIKIFSDFCDSTTYNSKNIDNINLFNKLEKIFTQNK